MPQSDTIPNPSIPTPSIGLQTRVLYENYKGFEHSCHASPPSLSGQSRSAIPTKDIPLAPFCPDLHALSGRIQFALSHQPGHARLLPIRRRRERERLYRVRIFCSTRPRPNPHAHARHRCHPCACRHPRLGDLSDRADGGFRHRPLPRTRPAPILVLGLGLVLILVGYHGRTRRPNLLNREHARSSSPLCSPSGPS